MRCLHHNTIIRHNTHHHIYLFNHKRCRNWKHSSTHLSSVTAKKSQAHITACNSMASTLGTFCKIVELHPKTFSVLHRVSTRFSLLKFITAPLLSILAIVYGIETYHNERAKHSTEISLTHLEKYVKSAKQRHPQCTTIKKNIKYILINAYNKPQGLITFFKNCVTIITLMLENHTCQPRMTFP
jgi:hypothetical protein